MSEEPVVKKYVHFYVATAITAILGMIITGVWKGGDKLSSIDNSMKVQVIIAQNLEKSINKMELSMNNSDKKYMKMFKEHDEKINTLQTNVAIIKDKQKSVRHIP